MLLHRNGKCYCFVEKSIVCKEKMCREIKARAMKIAILSNNNVKKQNK